MPPPSPSDHVSFRLHLSDKIFYVKQFNPSDNIPVDYLNSLQTNSSKFISITRTNEEISIVGETDDVSDKDASWKCIRIAGPMDFGVTGVMCNFTTPLKAANIPVFAVSTWNTDYILVPKDRAEQAVQALKEDGWTFV
ncbi:ACT domain-containing protein [Abortiporus biennis]|nr:ACT domain-containing protein [Abortiporus biennis]